MKKYFIFLIIILAALVRIPLLDKYPAGLNADEAAIGYNAYSLLQTGKDEHSVSWPLVFRSFDDYKPPMYFYLVLPFVATLGLNIWAVRLPSTLMGVASVYLIYLIVKRFQKKEKTTYLPELSALILATLPWHLQFSRGGWEVNAALFFILLGILFFLKSLEKPKFLIQSGVSFVFSIYTYHSARVITPLLVLFLAYIYRKKIFAKQNLTIVFLSVTLAVILALPIASQLLSKEGQSRFSGVSVFSDEGPLWQALELRREDNDSKLAKFIHNRYLSYSLRFTKNYLSHFSPRFLFVVGDEIARSKTPGVGQSLTFLFPFLFIGLFVLLKLDSKFKKFVLFWFLIAPIAASLTFQSPHALRAQNMTIPLSIITAMGIEASFIYLSRYRKIASIYAVTFFVGLAYFFARYLHQYYVHYPQELPYAWQYGFDQIAAKIQANYNSYDTIIISDRYDQPYILTAFFLKYPPQKLQSQLVMTPRDKFGFSTVRSFDKFQFHTINYDQDKKIKNALIISADESVDDKKVIDTILDPSGKVMYKLISTK